ncbi:synaptotagmin-like protein 3 isoform X6 [Erinaceus europaeus]|uniref:Synaptotagmin-like protein 3 isoform X6 n=1 Tax=Erinaceus europaeus TaxID=9365 RepID=A0ABM3YJH3_ERIEU|nr:synaptotagmin-like protein 3 isoform X6 [Erinaceus europaeus]
MAQEVHLNSLQELEREAVLQVLYRDQAVQNVEEERVRKLKARLQQLRWKGAKSAGQGCPEQRCARCQRGLGRLLNRGAVCRGCSHRVCSDCRVFLRRTGAWKCTVCFEDRNVKIKTGEWFFEERAKKFPAEGKHETAGARLLQSYQRLSSNISVVPPTPPPVLESQCSGISGRLQELGQFKGFNKSVENLFLSVTTHMKKLSKSQNDMTSDKQLRTSGPRRRAARSERRSLSDTAINVTTARKTSAPDILKPHVQESPQRPASPVSKQEDVPSSLSSSLLSTALRHGSLVSISSTCTEAGGFDKASVAGDIELALRYQQDSGTLEVCIGACRGLAFGEERKRRCNPYVKTYLLPDRSCQGKRKTAVHKNTVDPAFHETLKAEKSEDSNPTPPNNGELAVRAKLVLPGASRKFQDAPEETGQLSPSCDGQLCLVVLGARNLPVRSDGTLNSFVKGCLTLPDQQKLRLRSPVLRKQACPEWKHSFVFNGVSSAQLRLASLELTVWDQALFGVGERLLGGARLGPKDAVGSLEPGSPSKVQWQKVLSSPNLWTDMTLALH